MEKENKKIEYLAAIIGIEEYGSDGSFKLNNGGKYIQYFGGSEDVLIDGYISKYELERIIEWIDIFEI